MSLVKLTLEALTVTGSENERTRVPLSRSILNAVSMGPVVSATIDSACTASDSFLSTTDMPKRSTTSSEE